MVYDHFFSEEEVRFHLAWNLKSKCDEKTSHETELAKHVIFSIVVLGPVHEMVKATHDGKALSALVNKAYELISYSGRIDPVVVSGFFTSTVLQDIQDAMESTDREKWADYFSKLKIDVFTAKAKGIRQKHYA